MADQETEYRPEQGEPVDEQAEFAAFARRVGEHGGIDDPAPWEDPLLGEAKDSEAGADDAAADEPDDDDETPEEQADEASAEGEGKTDATDVQSLDDGSKAALKLDGLPDDLFEHWARTDRDGLERYARKRAANQRDVDQAFRELAQLRKRAETTQGSGEEAEQSAQPDAANLDELVQPLTEELGEETAGAVVKLAQELVRPVQQRMQEYIDSQQSAKRERVQQTVQATRQTLRERFPEVADDAAWDDVFKSAAHLEGHPDLAHLDDEARVKAALDWAARERYGTRDAESADASTRRAGKGPTSPRRKSPTKAVSRDEQELERWKARMEETGSIQAFL